MTWPKQTISSPLYPDLAWEKPERKDQAGKLLIIGGNLHGFAAAAKADGIAKEQGIGYTRILLPDCLRRTLAPLFTDAIFCPSTPSGGFSKDSTDLWLQNALWADGILLAGDFGRNSETAIAIDTLLSSYSGPLVITKDALDYYIENPAALLSRSNAVLVGSFAQIQKILSKVSPEPLTYSMPIASLVGTLQRFTAAYPVMILTKMDNIIYTALGGACTTTQLEDASEVWRLEYSTKAAVSLVQHPGKKLEAVTYSILS